MSEKRPDMWDTPDAEVLRYFDRDEAIEMIIDGTWPDKPPETIEVVGYARRKVEPYYLSGDLLEVALERLDEEFGDGEDSFLPTEKMKEAEEIFIDAILAEYTPWQCEPVVSEKVNTREWLKEHKPDWYDEIYGNPDPSAA